MNVSVAYPHCQDLGQRPVTQQGSKLQVFASLTFEPPIKPTEKS